MGDLVCLHYLYGMLQNAATSSCVAGHEDSASIQYEYEYIRISTIASRSLY